MDKMFSVFLGLILCCFLWISNPTQDAHIYHQLPDPTQETLIKYNANGKLSYGLYANKGEKEKLNLVPDFSFAGYKGGGVALPDVPVKITLKPVAGDNLKQIQDAINEVSQMPEDKNGFRGKILLKAGTYSINGSLKIKANGVVLAGEGPGKNGSVLRAGKFRQHIFIYLGKPVDDFYSYQNTLHKITNEYVPTGAVQLNIDHASNYSIGDTIVLLKTPNQEWIEALDMAQYGWNPEEYRIPHERIITDIAGSLITINIPIVDPIRRADGGGAIYKLKNSRKTRQSGIENLRLISAYKHDEDEDHSWTAVKLQMTENCWVKNITALYFGFSAVTIDKYSAFNTIEDCLMLDPKAKTEGMRKYSFNIQSGSFNLFQRCFARGGRHDFVTGPRVTGPNVFLDCYTHKARSDIGPHHRWATGTLFDNIMGQEIRVRNRKSSGTGHGWAGAQTMLWNCISTTNKGITLESPPGSINWMVGGEASVIEGNGYKELTGMQVTPRSLYLAQLKERLGEQAVLNITIPEQRNGVIYNHLAERAID